MRPVRSLATLLVLTLAAACGEAGPVNPPTEPARSIETEDSRAAPEPSQTSMLPGRGATSFVGRWVADVAWCAVREGERRPIEITATRFEGPASACAIAAVDEVSDGYIATLACIEGGQARSERVRFQVTGDVLALSWLERGSDPVTLQKCTTLEDTATAPLVP